jgi:hypothetical protein
VRTDHIWVKRKMVSGRFAFRFRQENPGTHNLPYAVDVGLVAVAPGDGGPGVAVIAEKSFRVALPKHVGVLEVVPCLVELFLKRKPWSVSLG